MSPLEEDKHNVCQQNANMKHKTDSLGLTDQGQETQAVI